VRPDQVTFVPERRAELTTEGGLDVAGQADRVGAAVSRCRDAGLEVSLFIDPDPAQVEAARRMGAVAVELHTGRYAHSWRTGDAALDQLRHAARHAADMGLFVHAGHGLTYQNVVPVARIVEIEELNIGHSVVSRAVMTGMRAAVEAMRHLVKDAGS